MPRSHHAMPLAFPLAQRPRLRYGLVACTCYLELPAPENSTSTFDGSTFAPSRPLNIEGFVGIAGLTAYSGGLAILWGENAGGRAHLLQTGDGGATFDDTTLPLRGRSCPRTHL